MGIYPGDCRRELSRGGVRLQKDARRFSCLGRTAFDQQRDTWAQICQDGSVVLGLGRVCRLGASACGPGRRGGSICIRGAVNTVCKCLPSQEEEVSRSLLLSRPALLPTGRSRPAISRAGRLHPGCHQSTTKTSGGAGQAHFPNMSGDCSRLPASRRLGAAPALPAKLAFTFASDRRNRHHDLSASELNSPVLGRVIRLQSSTARATGAPSH